MGATRHTLQNRFGGGGMTGAAVNSARASVLVSLAGGQQIVGENSRCRYQTRAM